MGRILLRPRRFERDLGTFEFEFELRRSYLVTQIFLVEVAGEEGRHRRGPPSATVFSGRVKRLLFL